MPFRYKLQKVLDFRIRKKEEQEAIVTKARQKLYMAEQKVEQNKQEIMQVSTARKHAEYTMMEYYDKYLHHLWDKAEVLENERKEAEQELAESKKKMTARKKQLGISELFSYRLYRFI